MLVKRGMCQTRPSTHHHPDNVIADPMEHSYVVRSRKYLSSPIFEESFPHVLHSNTGLGIHTCLSVLMYSIQTSSPPLKLPVIDVWVL